MWSQDSSGGNTAVELFEILHAFGMLLLLALLLLELELWYLLRWGGKRFIVLWNSSRGFLGKRSGKHDEQRCEGGLREGSSHSISSSISRRVQTNTRLYKQDCLLVWGYSLFGWVLLEQMYKFYNTLLSTHFFVQSMQMS